MKSTAEPKRLSSGTWRHDAKRYRLHNVVERFINRLKRFRRVATRDDKHDTNLFEFVCRASLMTILR